MQSGWFSRKKVQSTQMRQTPNDRVSKQPENFRSLSSASMLHTAPFERSKKPTVKNLVYRDCNWSSIKQDLEVSEVVSETNHSLNRWKSEFGFELAHESAAFFAKRIQGAAFDVDLDVSNLAKESENMYFTGNHNSIKGNKNWFWNYSNHLVYEANILLNWTDINKELTAKDTKMDRNDNRTIDDRHAMCYETPDQTEKYSYILSQQTLYTLLENAFSGRNQIARRIMMKAMNWFLRWEWNNVYPFATFPSEALIRGELLERKKKNARLSFWPLLEAN